MSLDFLVHEPAHEEDMKMDGQIEHSKLTRSVGEFEAMLGRITDLADKNFDDHRREAVRLRRLIADQTATIRSLGEAAYAGSESLEVFRQEFSKLRTAMALHYSAWAVVSIDLENPLYLASVSALRKANRDFIAWIKLSRPH
ncbi:hypothetical protein [Sphingopyxis sp. 550A]